MAWKDEAFELGVQWANVYETGSASRKLICDMMNTYFLVNVVHNDFKDPDTIFRGFHEAAASFHQVLKGAAMDALGENLQNSLTLANGMPHGYEREAVAVA